MVKKMVIVSATFWWKGFWLQWNNVHTVMVPTRWANNSGHLLNGDSSKLKGLRYFGCHCFSCNKRPTFNSIKPLFSQWNNASVSYDKCLDSSVVLALFLPLENKCSADFGGLSIPQGNKVELGRSLARSLVPGCLDPNTPVVRWTTRIKVTV